MIQEEALMCTHVTIGKTHARRTEACFALWTSVVEDYTGQSLSNHSAMVDSKSKMVAAPMEL